MTEQRGLLLLLSFFSLLLKAEMPPVPPMVPMPIPSATVTVLIDGTGSGSVTISGQSCSRSCTMSVPKGTNVGYYGTWAIPGIDSIVLTPEATPTQSLLPLTVNGDLTVKVTFQIKINTVLTVSLLGSAMGRVESEYPGTIRGPIDCGATCTGAIDRPDALKLTAIPRDGHKFVGWQGGLCDKVTAPTCSVKAIPGVPVTTIGAIFAVDDTAVKPDAILKVIITRPRPTLGPNYTVVGETFPRVALTGVNIKNAGVACSDSTCYCPPAGQKAVPFCEFKFYGGTVVQLTAPDYKESYTDGAPVLAYFEKWQRGGVEVSRDPNYFVTVTAARSEVIEAVYTKWNPKSVKVQVAILPDRQMGIVTGGKILYGATDLSVSPPVDRNRDHTWVPAGESLTLTATAQRGYEFCEWVGYGKSSTLTYPVPAGTPKGTPLLVTARFATECNPLPPLPATPTPTTAPTVTVAPMPPAPGSTSPTPPPPPPTIAPPVFTPAPTLIAPPPPVFTPTPTLIAPPPPIFGPTPSPTLPPPPVFFPTPTPAPFCGDNRCEPSELAWCYRDCGYPPATYSPTPTPTVTLPPIPTMPPTPPPTTPTPSPTPDPDACATPHTAAEAWALLETNYFARDISKRAFDLARSARPLDNDRNANLFRSSKLGKCGVEYAKVAGIRVVLSLMGSSTGILQTGGEVRFNTVERDAAAAQGLDFKVVSIPVQDNDNFRGTILGLVGDALTEMKKAGPANKMIVHCVEGINRTGLASANYLFDQGVGIADRAERARLLYEFYLLRYPVMGLEFQTKYTILQWAWEQVSGMPPPPAAAQP